MNKDKFLVIELEEETSVPRVFYKGEEIKNKQKINFNWITGDQNGEIFPANFLVQYVETKKDGAVVKAKKQGDTSDKIDCVADKLDDIQEQIRLLTEEYDKLNRVVYLDGKAVGSVWDDVEYRSDY